MCFPGRVPLCLLGGRIFSLPAVPYLSSLPHFAHFVPLLTASVGMILSRPSLPGHLQCVQAPAPLHRPLPKCWIPDRLTGGLSRSRLPACPRHEFTWKASTDHTARVLNEVQSEPPELALLKIKKVVPLHWESPLSAELEPWL